MKGSKKEKPVTTGDVSKWGFIPSEQIIRFEEDYRNFNQDTDDIYER